MLLSHQARALNEYIVSKQHTKFDWGTNDCHTFVAECHDIIYGEHTVYSFRGQYHSMLSAVRYQRDKLKTKDWLTTNHYRQVTDQLVFSDVEIEDGDIVILQTTAGYYSAAIVLDGIAHSFNVVANYYQINDPRSVYDFDPQLTINIQQDDLGIAIAELWRRQWA